MTPMNSSFLISTFLIATVLITYVNGQVPWQLCTGQVSSVFCLGTRDNETHYPVNGCFASRDCDAFIIGQHNEVSRTITWQMFYRVFRRIPGNDRLVMFYLDRAAFTPSRAPNAGNFFPRNVLIALLGETRFCVYVRTSNIFNVFESCNSAAVLRTFAYRNSSMIRVVVETTPAQAFNSITFTSSNIINHPLVDGSIYGVRAAEEPLFGHLVFLDVPSIFQQSLVRSFARTPSAVQLFRADGANTAVTSGPRTSTVVMSTVPDFDNSTVQDDTVTVPFATSPTSGSAVTILLLVVAIAVVVVLLGLFVMVKVKKSIEGSLNMRSNVSDGNANSTGSGNSGGSGNSAGSDFSAVSGGQGKKSPNVVLKTNKRAQVKKPSSPKTSSPKKEAPPKKKAKK